MNGADDGPGGMGPGTSAAPLRSLMMVPGDRAESVVDALSAGADAVACDLGDSVAASRLGAARLAVRTVVGEHAGQHSRIFVRVAAPGSAMLDDDLDAVVVPGLTGLVLPGVTCADEVRAVSRRLGQLEAERGMTVGSTVVMPMVDTAQGARFAYDIASSSARIAFMGAVTSAQGDLSRHIGFRWTPVGTESLVLRSWVLLQARAAGVRFPVSGVWTLVDDLDGLRAFAEQARGLGYSGLVAIHPTHVAIINEIFTPTEQEIDQWREVITTMRAAQAQGVGALRFHGELLDEAHVKTAVLGLELAARLDLVPASEILGPSAE